MSTRRPPLFHNLLPCFPTLFVFLSLKFILPVILRRISYAPVERRTCPTNDIINYATKSGQTQKCQSEFHGMPFYRSIALGANLDMHWNHRQHHKYEYEALWCHDVVLKQIQNKLQWWMDNVADFHKDC